MKQNRIELRRRQPAAQWRVRPFILTVVCSLLAFHAYFLYGAVLSRKIADQKPSSSIIGGTIFSSGLTAPAKPDLPAWINNYVAWHKEMRRLFPGSLLFEDPKAPKLLVRTCLGLCGGLNDRLGQLPWDLYLANQTQRVLLLHWHRPVPLEHFLLPNELDWSVPRDVPEFFGPNHGVRADREAMKEFRNYATDLFEGYKSETPTAEFWEKHLDEALHRATHGAFREKKILRHRILGHIAENVLEARLRSLGETDMLHRNLSFGKIFQMFFKPSPGVQEELDFVFQSLKLTSRNYSAVHCRVRHPKAHPKNVNVKGKNEDYTADKTGLPWEGSTRDFAIQTATRAVKCAQTLLRSKDEPIYFFSDSVDLVRYMSRELTLERFRAANATLLKASPVDSEARRVVEHTHILARDVTIENAHIDKQKGRDAPAYYATFVDLYLAIHARCVTFGVGFYAVLATKISGTPCKLLYQEESWGSFGNKSSHAPLCSLPG